MSSRPFTLKKNQLDEKNKNFTQNISRRKTDHKKNSIELECSRDLFGRLLFLATEKNLDV